MTVLAVLALYAGLLLLPGLAIGYGLGLRGWTLAGTAPLTTYALVAATGTVCTLTGLDWSPLTLLGAAAAGTALAFGVRVLRPVRRAATGPDEVDLVREERWPGWRGAMVVAATVIGAGLSALALADASGGLANPPQDWDSQFHANAVRYIADTADADPAALAAINHYERPDRFYYPNGWHLVTAAVYRISGHDMTLTFNAGIVLVGPMLTLGLVALLRQFRVRPALAAATALCSAGASAIPYDLIMRGPLITYGTGVVLVPAFLIMLYRAVGDRSWAASALTAASAAALLVIHPGAAIVAAVFAVAMIAERWLLDRGRVRRDLLMLAGTGAVTAVLAAPAVLGSFNSVADSPVFVWPADMMGAHSFADVFLFSHLSQYPRWFMAVPLIVALFALRRIRQLWWLLGGSVVFALLFIASASYVHPLIPALTRPWWNDRWRIIAVSTIGAIVLAAHGIVVISDALRRRSTRLAGLLPAALGERTRFALRTTPLVPVLLIAAIMAGSSAFYLPDNVRRVEKGQYRPGPGLSPLEREGVDVLATLVPPGARVMNQDGDGSAWMFAMAGVLPVNGHIETGGRSPNQQLLHDRFNQLDTDPQVRRVVEQLNIQYVFIGRGYVRTFFRRDEGLRRLDLVRSLELVYENPDVRIYKILPTPSKPAS